MKPLLPAALLLAAAAANAEDWILVAADEAGRTYLGASSMSRNEAREARFQLKLVHPGPRDMMGLRYDASLQRYALACESNRIVWSQKLLLNAGEVVWTFPESGDAAAADAVVPAEALRRVCR